MDTNTVIFAGILLVMVIISVSQYIYKAKENDGVITKDEILNIIGEIKNQVINDVFTIAAFRNKSEIEQNEILMQEVTSFIASSSFTEQEKKLIEANMESIVNKLEEEVKDKLEDIKISDTFKNVINDILDNAVKSNNKEDVTEPVESDTSKEINTVDSTVINTEESEMTSIDAETKMENKTEEVSAETITEDKAVVEETKVSDDNPNQSENSNTEIEQKETTSCEVVADADTKSEF